MEETTQRKNVQKYFKKIKGHNGLQTIVVREFELADKLEVQQIFYEGLMEMVADTAFRGLRHHPESLLLYTAMTSKTFMKQKPGGAVELQRMSVDRSCRRCGVGVALGQKVVEFAVTHRYSSVVLGTTAYTAAAHQLYRRLGFHCVGFTNGYVTPGARCSLLERIFYRVRHHHYKLNVQNSKITVNGQH
ncbi:LOW QUALITY PROTEIN: N-acetylaspartate synthetase-like [Anoplopoma fimbria]|uniref:LOW QUALITY PROTEIN: N-acetylaspartate synthetase-like n=1 Tax=Anoplopoma fimbria TaxID=229290 RepID=UPI0023EDB9C8|nr:LOW QUALITY PROTEIN: N-acetylaspartate synthetase-like [Anoplopoma fimbria]